MIEVLKENTVPFVGTARIEFFPAQIDPEYGLDEHFISGYVVFDEITYPFIVQVELSTTRSNRFFSLANDVQSAIVNAITDAGNVRQLVTHWYFNDFIKYLESYLTAVLEEYGKLQKQRDEEN